MNAAKNNFMLTSTQRLTENKKLSRKSVSRMAKTKSANTLNAYESDWQDFFDWCRHHGLSDLPAEPETVINYINDLADFAKANTVSRRLSAISENHIAAGFEAENPIRSELVKIAIKAIRREKGIMQKGKTPLLLEDLEEFAAFFRDGDIVGQRDKALLLVGFAGALRRSELVKLDVEDLTFTKDGVILLIANSKADQVGLGNYIAIPYHDLPQFCAVKALQNWLNNANIRQGPVFRPITKYKTIRSVRLSDKSVALIVKKYAQLLGLNSDDFAGHSLRRGFATSAAQHDVDEMLIMRQTRHKSEKMVRRYIEQGDLFRKNAFSKMLRNS